MDYKNLLINIINELSDEQCGELYSYLEDRLDTIFEKNKNFITGLKRERSELIDKDYQGEDIEIAVREDIDYTL
jgi:hypothetical protein